MLRSGFHHPSHLKLSFLAPSGFYTLWLAYLQNSLVRVSRRVGWSHFDKIARKQALRPVCSLCQATLTFRETVRRVPDLFLHSDLILPIGTQGYMQGMLIAQDKEPDEVLQNQGTHAYAVKSRPNNIPSTTSFSTISSLLTLFSKFFSSFLRSTCSLSVSHKYLALEEVYLPFRAAIPNNPTLRNRSYGQASPTTGLSPSMTSCSKELMRDPCLLRESLDYNSLTMCRGFTLWAFACSLAATGAILVSFFSSAYWYA